MDCLTPYMSTNIVFSSTSPFDITGIVNDVLGWHEELCYKCSYNGVPITQNIILTQKPKPVPILIQLPAPAPSP